VRDVRSFPNGLLLMTSNDMTVNDPFCFVRRLVRRPGRAAALLMPALLAAVPATGQQPATPLPTMTPAAANETAGQASARVLTLDEALPLAEARSEQVAIAQAGVRRATSEFARARSERLPQVNASGSYDRTLASEFENLFGGGSATPSCAPFAPNATAPVADRVSEIERALDCGAFNPFSSGGSGSSLQDLPFGRKNIYRLNLTFSQNIYAGGRIGAQEALASESRRLADVSLASARAQSAFETTEAYYDAAVSDELLLIATAALKQAEDTLSQAELAWKAGRTPEFELLRARVARDNQRPTVIRARAQRNLAHLRLKQILELPAGTTLQLAANLVDPVLAVPARFAEGLARTAEAATQMAEDRAPVRQARLGVAVRQTSVRLAHAARFPTISLNSQYGRVAYPSGTSGFDDWRTNWTLGAAVQLPIFNGGRIRAEEAVAQADLADAQARLQQAREFTQLDTASAYEQMASAQAAWEASAGTVEQAGRAYEIAELRYREGISTQLELSDARLLLEQAGANRAQAARDLQVARARVALLPDLPLSVGAASAGATASMVGASGAAGGQTSGGRTTGTTGSATPGGATGGASGTGSVIR
jgi:outer membrane protein TolC